VTPPLRIVLMLLEPPLPFGNAAARWYYVALRELVRRGHRVTAFAACSKAEDIEPARQLFPAPDYDLHCYASPARRGLLQKLATLGRPYSYLFSPELRRDLWSELDRGEFDVFHLEQLWSAWLVGRFAERAVLNVHYLFSIDESAEPPGGATERVLRARTAAAERALLRRFHTLSAVSPRLAECARQINPRASVFTTPLGIDAALYEFRPQLGHVAAPVVGLIGSLNWRPTRAAAVRLITRLWPEIRRQVPAARLQIVGRAARSSLAQYLAMDGLTVLEDVPDTRPHFAATTCMIYAPGVGSGMKVKLMEAFAMGTAVVTNREGAEGLAVEDGVHVGLADDDAGLIERAVRLLRDPAARERQARAARTLLEQRYGASATVDGLEALYCRLVESAHTRAKHTRAKRTRAKRTPPPPPLSQSP
jgi:glycosyltransferase involved in cell wall biosynthesis